MEMILETKELVKNYGKKSAVNNVVTIPRQRVTANPLTGPEPI